MGATEYKDTIAGQAGLLQGAIEDCTGEITRLFIEGITKCLKGGDKVNQERCANIIDPKPAHEFKAGDFVWCVSDTLIKGSQRNFRTPHKNEMCQVTAVERNRALSEPDLMVRYSAVPECAECPGWFQRHFRPVRVGDKVESYNRNGGSFSGIVNELRNGYINVRHETLDGGVSMLQVYPNDKHRFGPAKLVERTLKVTLEVTDPDCEAKESASKALDGCCFACAKFRTSGCAFYSASASADSTYNTSCDKNYKELCGEEANFRICVSLHKDCWYVAIEHEAQDCNVKPAQPDKFPSHKPVVPADELARRQSERANRADVFCAHGDCRKLAVIGQGLCYSHLPTPEREVTCAPPMCLCGQELYRSVDGTFDLSRCPDCAGLGDGKDLEAVPALLPILRGMKFTVTRGRNPMVGTFGSGSNLF